MQSIFHCDYFTFNHRYYDFIASPKFKNNFCNSTYEVGIYPAFLLQSTLQFCFALAILKEASFEIGYYLNNPEYFSEHVIESSVQKFLTVLEISSKIR